MSDVVPWPDRNDPNQRYGLLFRRKKKRGLSSGDEVSGNQSIADAAIERVGNFLRSDESLLVRKARANRYSAKFRDGVVNRILSGGLTISQARKELNVSERDLLDWINDRIMKQDQKIAKLTQVVDAVGQLAIEGSFEMDDAEISFPDESANTIDAGDAVTLEVPRPHSKRSGSTIEGRVN